MTKKTLTGWLIDPKAGCISRISIPHEGDNLLPYLYKAMGCDLVELVRAPIGDVWVDEEGLFKQERHQFGVKVAPGQYTPLVGRAVILDSDEEGETTSCTAEIGTVLDAILVWGHGMWTFPALGPDVTLTAADI